MKVRIEGNRCIVRREEGDPSLRDESHLIYRIKLELNRAGHNFIKKLMYKDGHLVDYHLHYIRAKHPEKLEENSGEIFCIWACSYVVYDILEEYRENGEIVLDVERV